MALRSDDITRLFQPAPAEPAQPVTYRQGKIVDWNPITLQNKVLVGGTLMQDLPVLGVAEAASFKPGAVVGIQVVGSTWAIVGRFVVPNTAEATDAITALGQNIASNNVDTSESTTNGSYVDLATVGPSADMFVRASGKVLVIVSCRQTGLEDEGHMSFAVSGANTVSAAAAYEYSCGTPVVIVNGAGSRLTLLTGLNPGLSTFTAKYRSGGGTSRSFQYRNITVFAL